MIKREKLLEIIYAGTLGAIAIFVGHNSPWIHAILDWLQLTLVFSVLVLIIRDEDRFAGGTNREEIALGQFWRYWRRLWGAWLLLYIIFAFRSTVEAMYGGDLHLWYWKTGFNLAANLMNNLQSFAVFLIYLVMTKRTTEPGASHGLRFASGVLFWTILLLALLEAGFSFASSKLLELAPSASFSADDIMHLPRLADKLQNPSDPVSLYLKSRLSTTTIGALSNYQGVTLEAAPLRSLVLKDLNRTIQSGQSIFEELRFSTVLLRPETEVSLGQKLDTNHMAWLNRDLLDDAFPLELRKRRSSADLLASDIKDFPSLATKLKEQLDGVSAFLFGQLSVLAQSSLTNFSGLDGHQRTIQSNLVSDFNRIVHSELIYDRVRFVKVIKGRETEKLLAQSLNGRNMARLNHLLLEDAYPKEIGRARDEDAKASWVVAEVAGIICSTFSGLFAGVAFCLFFARLGSHYIRLSSFWIAVLFLYAAIQPLYPVFRIAGTYSLVEIAPLQIIQITLKIFAAVLKLVLFLRVREILQDDRLLFFMKRIAEDHDHVLAQQQEFHAARLGAGTKDEHGSNPS